MEGAADTLPSDGLRSLPEVMGRHSPTLRHVPATARSLWAKCVVQEMAKLIHSSFHYNDVASWHDLLMLPNCVLRLPVRGGEKNSPASARRTVTLCNRWLEGDCRSLWSEVSATQPRKRLQEEDSVEISDAKLEYYSQMAAEMLLSKTCSALLARLPLGTSAKVLAELCEKRPTTPPPDFSDVPATSPAAWHEVGSGLVHKAHSPEALSQCCRV